MNKLSRKDIAMLEVLAVTQESKGKLAEYIQQREKAADAYKAFREAVVSGFEVQTDSELPRMINSLPTVGEVTGVIEYKNGVPSRYVSDDEPKRKFKAGDKVRVLETRFPAASSFLRMGDITKVVDYKEDQHIDIWTNPQQRPVVVEDFINKSNGYFEESALELVEEKTPNELRAEIIEKAKEVLVEWKDRDGSYLHPSPCGFHFNTRVEFKVNTKKRVVVALLRNLGITENIRTKGIASCSKSDVYNEHIGKAIALGRALGKDVSEFENAVQPDMPTVGHKFTCVYDDKEHEISVYDSWRASIEGTYEYLTKEDVDLGHIKLVDDTNAQYGGIE